MKQETQIIANLRKATRQNISGREFLVAPATILKQQTVMNGFFYPEKSVKEFHKNWNGTTITVQHTDSSANTPENFATREIGRVFNANMVDGCVVCDFWIDIEKAKSLGHETLLNQIESSEKLEVSTGLTADVSLVDGIINENPYKGIVDKIYPDHVAIITNGTGACSVAHGCGLNNCSGSQDSNSMLQTLINFLKGGNTMTTDPAKKTLIDNIIVSTKNTFAESDRATLEAHDTVFLQNINVDEPKKEEQKEDPAVTKLALVNKVIETNDAFDATSGGVLSQMSPEQLQLLVVNKTEATGLSADDKALLQNLRNERDAKRADITARVQKQFPNITNEMAAGMDISVMDAMLATKPDYSGQAGGMYNNAAGGDEKNAPPSVLLNSKTPDEALKEFDAASSTAQ